MSDGRRSGLGAIELLQRQHRQILEQLRLLAEAAPERRSARLGQVRALVLLHGALEAQVFYPATMDLRPDAVVEAALDDHDNFARMLADLDELSTGDPQYLRHVHDLYEQFRRHAELEEDSLFTKVRRQLDPDVLDDLAEQMAQLTAALSGDRTPDEWRAVEGSSPPTPV